MGSLAWPDIAMLAVLAVSMLIGVFRGFAFEVLSLAGWVVAYFGAQYLAPWADAFVPLGKAGSTLRYGLSFALAFVVVLVAWSLLARLVKLLVSASPLSAVDRGLGALFGAARGVVVLLAAITLLAMTPAPRSSVWQASQGVGLVQGLLHGLKPLLPQELAQHVRA